MSGRTGRRFTVVGIRPAAEAISAGAARELLVVRKRRSREIGTLLSAAERAAVPVRRVDEHEVASVGGGAHQGVACRVELPPLLTERDLQQRAWSDQAVVVVLDGVTDPRNVGAIARTAEAAGAEALVLRRRRSAGITPSAVKTSAGALLLLPVATVPNIPRALDRLRGTGFWIGGLDVGGAPSVLAARPPAGRLALVLGAEDRGLARLVRARCDELYSIPMRGRVGSLNVAVAAGIALFGLAAERRR